MYVLRKSPLRKLCAMLLAVCILAGINPDANAMSGKDISAVTAVLMDAKTGKVLFSKGMNKRMYPASMTKIMTGLLVVENSSPGDKGMFDNAPYPGVINLLEQLRAKGGILALATSKASFYAEQILAHFDMAKYFAFLSGSELDGRRSEKSQLIEYALANLPGAAAENTVMIGDRKHDIIGAKAVGVTGVGVLYGYGSLDELKEAGADHIAEDVKSLADLLS